MERTIFLLLLCTAVEGDIGKHIFVPKSMKWQEAQTYCRQHHSDLSSVSSQNDVDKILKAAGTNNPAGWIGLYRDFSNITGWKWSGAGNITYQNWGNGQPDNHKNMETTVQILSNGKWNDLNEEYSMPFYCFHIAAVEVNKSWDEALEHCRVNGSTLISLLSETERLLAQKEIQKVTERMWIGLRYLGGSWLWVNGDRLVYEAWPQGGDQDHLCPIQKRCGALTKDGLWENRDCQDRLNFICDPEYYTW